MTDELQQQQQQRQQSALAAHHYIDDAQEIKPYSNTWTTTKELFLCRKVLRYMPDILTKSKTSLWKKVLDDFNHYFNNNGYKIKQTRTMRDKFLRLYGKFLNENKPIERMNQLETVLHAIKMGELDKARYKDASQSIVPNEQSSVEEGTNEDEEEEEDEMMEEPQDSHIVQPPIVPTQKLGGHHQAYHSAVQSQTHQQPAVSQPPHLHISQPSPSANISQPPQPPPPPPPQQQQQQQFTQTSPIQPLTPGPYKASNSVPSGYATVHFKMPNEFGYLNSKIENMESDLKVIKKDVDVIKSQLASLLNILNGNPTDHPSNP